MKIIIIAAGFGKRLGKYTENTPKSLVEVNGISILDRQVSSLNKINSNEIIIVIGPNKSKFTNKNFHYVEDCFFDEHEQLGSLMQAKDHFDDELLVLFSDVLFDEKIISNVNNIKCDIGLVIDLNWRKNYEARTDHPVSQADLVEIIDNKITKIQKNLDPNVNSTVGEFIGMIKFSSKGAKEFLKFYQNLEKNHIGKFQTADSFKKAYLTDIFSDMIEKHHNVTPIFVDGTWCEIDTPQDLKQAEKYFV